MFSNSPKFKKFEIPSDLDPTITNNLIKGERWAFVIKMIFAAALVGIGAWLIFLGIGSESTIKFKISGAEFELNNVLPGLTVIILGFLIGFFSKQSITIKK